MKTLINFNKNHIALVNKKTYTLVPCFNLLGNNALRDLYKEKNAEFLKQNWLLRSLKVKSALAPHHVTCSTICVKTFLLVLKSANKAP